MKNKFPVIIFAGIVLIAAAVLMMRKNSSSSLKTAQQQESIGDIKKACALYADAVYNLVPSVSLPDITHSKFVEPETYRKEVEKYLSALTENNLGRKNDVTAAVSGLIRCNQSEKGVVRYTDPAVKPFTNDTYYDEWKKTFFADEAKVDPSHESLAEGNFSRNLSLIILSCGKNYSYECVLLNKATLQATKCFLPAENSARFYALPGEYLVIARSTVTFPNGDIWRSDFVALPISVPEKASLITSEMQTRAHRK